MEYMVNSGQRSAAFLKFFILFLVTTLAVVSAVYVGINIPIKDNEQLREQVKNYQGQIDNQEQFITRIATVKNLIDSMGKSGQIKAIIDLKIAGQLNQLQQAGTTDSSIYTSLNNEVWSLLNEYNELSKKLIYSKDAIQKAGELQDKLVQCQKDLRETQNSLDACRSFNATSGN